MNFVDGITKPEMPDYYSRILKEVIGLSAWGEIERWVLINRNTNRSRVRRNEDAQRFNAGYSKILPLVIGMLLKQN